MVVEVSSHKRDVRIMELLPIVITDSKIMEGEWRWGMGCQGMEGEEEKRRDRGAEGGGTTDTCRVMNVGANHTCAFVMILYLTHAP